MNYSHCVVEACLALTIKIQQSFKIETREEWCRTGTIDINATELKKNLKRSNKTTLENKTHAYKYICTKQPKINNTRAQVRDLDAKQYSASNT